MSTVRSVSPSLYLLTSRRTMLIIAARPTASMVSLSASSGAPGSERHYHSYVLRWRSDKNVTETGPNLTIPDHSKVLFLYLHLLSTTRAWPTLSTYKGGSRMGFTPILGGNYVSTLHMKSHGSPQPLPFDQQLARTYSLKEDVNCVWIEI